MDIPSKLSLRGKTPEQYIDIEWRDFVRLEKFRKLPIQEQTRLYYQYVHQPIIMMNNGGSNSSNESNPISDMFTNSSEQQVVWVIGDSHTRARGSGAYGPTPSASTVYQFYNGTINQIGNTDIQQDVDDVNWGSIWPQFGINYFNGTGKKPVFALSGIGGTTFNYNSQSVDNWSSASNLYNTSKTFCDQALSAVGVSAPKYIVVGLGNNDAFYDSPLSSISESITQVFTTLTTDYPNSEVLVIQNGKLAATSINARIIEIRRYLIDAARTFPSVSIGANMATLDPVGGCFLPDGVHMSQSGNNHIGNMLGKFVSNNSYSKWVRSIISNHFSELNASRKTLINNFVNSVSASLFDADFIGKFKAPTEQDTYVDYSFLTAFYNLGSFTFTSDNHITTDGTSSYGRINFIPNIAQRVSQNDISVELKVKNNRNTDFATLLGGGTGVTRIQIGQTPTNAYSRINDVTTSSFGESDFANSSSYAAERTSSTIKRGYKNGTQVFNVSVTSTSPGSFALNLGCLNSSGTPNDFANADFEWAIVCKPSSREILRSAMETLCNNW